MNTETIHKGYDSLTDEQLVELAQIIHKAKWEPATQPTIHINAEMGYRLVTIDHFETEFWDNGHVAARYRMRSSDLYHPFSFVDKCREFGLTY